MQTKLKTLLGVAGIAFATQAAAQVTFYEDEGFRGRSLTTEGTVWDLAQYGFNGRAESAVISGGRWQACEQANFQGHCVILEPGNYDSLTRLGVNQQIASVRPAAAVSVSYYPTPAAYVGAAPDVLVAAPADDQRYDARVTTVRAVIGAPGRQCWVEKQQIGPQELPGAIAGGVMDVLAGRQSSLSIDRCWTVPDGARPSYWDVAYEFRGTERHVQLAAPPGQTIAVNGYGDPLA